MSINMDLTAVHGEDDFAGGNTPEPGQYHFQVIDVDDSLTERDAIVVNLAVLGGTVEDSRSKRLRESFWMSDKAQPRLQHFALVTGLAKAGEKTAVNFKNAVGKDFVAEVVEDSYEKDGETRTSRKLGYATLWSTGNPKVADVPRGELFVISNGSTVDTTGTDDGLDPDSDLEDDFEF